MSNPKRKSPTKRPAKNALACATLLGCVLGFLVATLSHAPCVGPGQGVPAACDPCEEPEPQLVPGSGCPSWLPYGVPPGCQPAPMAEKEPGELTLNEMLQQAEVADGDVLILRTSGAALVCRVVDTTALLPEAPPESDPVVPDAAEAYLQIDWM